MALAVFFIPRMMAMYAQLNASLPFALQLVFGYSNLLLHSFIPFGFILFSGIFAILLAGHYFLHTKRQAVLIYSWGVFLVFFLVTVCIFGVIVFGYIGQARTLIR